jgi:hypothetical protein
MQEEVGGIGVTVQLNVGNFSGKTITTPRGVIAILFQMEYL